jgi:hypothetical protein
VKKIDRYKLTCATTGSDGLIAYWLDTASPKSVPSYTADGKPLIVITVANLELLRMRSEDFLALKKIWKDAPELQTDGVAKREVRQRLVEAEQLLNETVALAFNWSAQKNTCWIDGQLTAIESSRGFQSALSDLCDRIYDKGAVLDNELINRRELTSQGAKARRELIEAMLKNADKERLGLEGYGPEVAMYGSVLEATGIHRQEADEWGFHPPLPYIPAAALKGRLRSETPKATLREQSSENPLASATVDVSFVWDEIERFCTEAKDNQQTLDLLYQKLEQPPYGVKPGVIPILLAAFLLVHVDDIGIYKDGTFIPVLGPEHFELLVKEPSRFSVKYFEMVGLRSQVFKELERVRLF